MNEPSLLFPESSHPLPLSMWSFLCMVVSVPVCASDECFTPSPPLPLYMLVISKP